MNYGAIKRKIQIAEGFFSKPLDIKMPSNIYWQLNLLTGKIPFDASRAVNKRPSASQPEFQPSSNVVPMDRTPTSEPRKDQKLCVILVRTSSLEGRKGKVLDLIVVGGSGRLIIDNSVFRIRSPISLLKSPSTHSFRSLTDTILSSTCCDLIARLHE